MSRVLQEQSTAKHLEYRFSQFGALLRFGGPAPGLAGVVKLHDEVAVLAGEHVGFVDQGLGGQFADLNFVLKVVNGRGVTLTLEPVGDGETDNDGEPKQVADGETRHGKRVFTWDWDCPRRACAGWAE